MVFAGQLIKRGQTFSPEILKVEKRDTAQFPKRYFHEVGELAGKEAKITIASSVMVQDWMVQNPPLIRRGSRVKIIVQSGNLSLKAVGVAFDDGSKGDLVRVKMENTKKVVSGKVLALDEVEVKL